MMNGRTRITVALASLAACALAAPAIAAGPAPQLTPAQASALAGKACPGLTTGSHNLGRGWRLTITRCDYTTGPAWLELALSGRIKKNNGSLPDISTTGAIKVRGAIELKASLVPPELCAVTLQVTGVNFRNVQNDVEQLVRQAVNAQLAAANVFCIKTAGGGL